MEYNIVSDRSREIAQVFIEQYNLAKQTHYQFESLRKSMFRKFPAVEEIYEMSFIQGKKRSPIVADLMVLLRLQKRLIIDVVRPRYPEGFAQAEKSDGDRTMLLWEIVGNVDRLEIYALKDVVCSKHLLIDERGFGCVRIGDPASYRKFRLERDRLHERQKSFSLRKADELEFERKLSRRGIPTKHWFREIWLLHRDEKGVVRCLEIW